MPCSLRWLMSCSLLAMGSTDSTTGGSSQDAPAAVDDEVGAADPRRLVAGQEHGGAHHVLGLAVPAERDPVKHHLPHPLGRVGEQRGGVGGLDEAGTDHVG